MNKVGNVVNRRTIQWSVLPVIVVVIALGWEWTWLGFAVPIMMAMGMVGGFLHGRYVCGNLCPRGAFYDRIAPFFSPKRRIPSFFRRADFRWTVFAALMAMMAFRLSSNIGSANHWGLVFWWMCMTTTALGVVLAFFYHPRTWCSFCPIGTMQAALGGLRGSLKIDGDNCLECGTCEAVCPIDLEIVRHKGAGRVANRDCLKCPECIGECPKGALSWPSNK